MKKEVKFSFLSCVVRVRYVGIPFVRYVSLNMMMWQRSVRLKLQFCGSKFMATMIVLAMLLHPHSERILIDIGNF